MKAPKMIYKQINELTGALVSVSICSDYNCPIIKQVIKGKKLDICEIDISNHFTSSALRKIPYRDFFYEIVEARCYNLKLLDGALIQMYYKFENDKLISNRLGYFPNPDLATFQSNEDVYLEDNLYSDVIDPRIVVTPIRFDFDNQDGIAKDIEHPLSHLTIGQYKDCRIPVVRPLTPSQFITFIIRNFYHTAYIKYSHKMKQYGFSFEETITKNELSILHIGITDKKVTI